MAAASVSIIGLLVMVLVVVAPLIIGVLLIVKSKGRGPSYPACGGCGYDVTGTVGNAARCPECGKDFVVVGIVPPVGKRNRGMLLAGVAVLLIPLMCVGGGFFIAFLRIQTAVQSQKAAVIAQQQAVVAQAAQANATFPIPSPLSDEQIDAMSDEEASAAMGPVSAAFNRTDLSDADQSRLRHEWTRLAEKTNATNLPAPLTADQINAMSFGEAQAALSKVSVARRRAAHTPEEQARLKHEFELLLLRINTLRTGS